MTITDGGPRTQRIAPPRVAAPRTGTPLIPGRRGPGQRIPGQRAPVHDTSALDAGARSARTTAATPTSTAAAPRVRFGAQLAIVAAAVAAYFLVRGATEAAYPEALRNAHLLVDLERAVGIWWEPALQDALAASPRTRTVLNAIYIYGHWPVIVASLLWLAHSSPAIYLRARNAMLVSGGIGLVVFVSFPVAPPRLAGVGMTDTVSVASEAYRVLQPTMFTNQYAALPSLHVGWDLIIGLALASALRRPLLRALAMAMPVAMVVAVVLTANHYIVDAVAGAALTAACWAVARRLADRRAARPAHGAGAAGAAHGAGARPLRGDRPVRARPADSTLAEPLPNHA